MLDDCCTKMEDMITETSCWDILRASDAHGCTNLRQKAFLFASLHFSVLRTLPGFVLLPETLLCELLSSNHLWQVKEDNVFEACCTWLTAQHAEDEQVARVMAHCRLNLLTPEPLLTVVKTHPLMQGPEARALYHAALETTVRELSGVQRTADRNVRRCQVVNVVHSLTHDTESDAVCIAFHDNLMYTGVVHLFFGHVVWLCTQFGVLVNCFGAPASKKTFYLF
eukprot:c17851_g1_i1.p1 GENE.c17851_g1_i1~~c17851_g1_i1.p1  ORF type:complete len:224 (+),score=38.50 c17851_g1_i1:400-1071(+)